VLTSRSAAFSFASWAAAYFGALIVLSAATLTSAHAGGAGDIGCVGTGRSFNCAGQWSLAPGDPYVRTVPEALDETEKAQLTERERKWLARCKPVIEHDSYGVARYRYSASGCEFGVGRN